MRSSDCPHCGKPIAISIHVDSVVSMTLLRERKSRIEQQLKNAELKMSELNQEGKP